MAKRQRAIDVPQSLLDKYKDFGGVKVIERRLENPDPVGSLPIRLKDEPSHSEDPLGHKRTWYLRWINGEIDGRWAQIVDGMGYVAVTVDELQNPQAIAGLAKSEDGLVRKGDRGKEILVKMPLELYHAIKRAQQERRERRARNARLVKQDLADSAGRTLGDEAGETIDKSFTVDVLKRHKSTIGEELDGDRA